MFDIEKMLKPIFEKHIPTILESIEQNKKRDWIMQNASLFATKGIQSGRFDESNALSQTVSDLSSLYDLYQEEMKAQNIIK